MYSTQLRNSGVADSDDVMTQRAARPPQSRNATNIHEFGTITLHYIGESIVSEGAIVGL